MDSRFHGNDKPRRMSFPRKWESREGYLAYYPIIYLTFIMRREELPFSFLMLNVSVVLIQENILSGTTKPVRAASRLLEKVFKPATPSLPLGTFDGRPQKLQTCGTFVGVYLS